MSDSLTHNLFYYATSELSQDAFICWLLSFAYETEEKFASHSPSEDEKKLRNCAQELLYEFGKDRFVENGDSAKDLYLSKEPKRQKENIDIFLEVSGKKGNDYIYPVIIEDKTFTKEHDDQLTRYSETIKNEYHGIEPIKVYYKFGLQSNKEIIEKAEYLFFGLKNIAEFLEKYKYEIKNSIFKDYHEKVSTYKQDTEGFKTKNVGEWNEAQIDGFYEDLKNCKDGILTANSSKIKADYGYVPNQSGGIYAMWIEPKNSMEGIAELYLQCEYDTSTHKLNICFKASATSKIDAEMRKKLLDSNKEFIEKAHFEKPSRYGVGRHVTLGVIPIDSSCSSDDAITAIEKAIREFQDHFCA